MKIFPKILLIFTIIISFLGLSSCDKPKSNYVMPSERLKLEHEIEGKTFENDSIGKLEVYKFHDGDTVYFGSKEDHFKIRFLGVDTPETVGNIDPFGKKASEFTYEKLSKAKGIVGESEIIGEKPKKGSYGRYLGFIWYIPENGNDYVNLNLELMEQGFSIHQQLDKYDSYFKEAEEYAKNNKLGIWSGNDPDYTTDILDVSIKDLALSLNDKSDFKYENKRVKFEGYVIRRYHEEDDTGDSIIVEGIIDGVKYQVPVYIHTVDNEVFHIGNKCSFIGYATDLYGLKRITGVTLSQTEADYSKVLHKGYYLQFGKEVGISSKVNHFYTDITVIEMTKDESGKTVVIGQANRGLTDIAVTVKITLNNGELACDLVGKKISTSGYSDEEVTISTKDIKINVLNANDIEVHKQN